MRRRRRDSHCFLSAAREVLQGSFGANMACRSVPRASKAAGSQGPQRECAEDADTFFSSTLLLEDCTVLTVPLQLQLSLFASLLPEIREKDRRRGCKGKGEHAGKKT